MACGALGYNDAGLVFLGASVFFVVRDGAGYFCGDCVAAATPAVLRTSLGIQLAPALVACSAD